MKIKSDKGITLIALMVVVIILAILAVTGVKLGLNLTDTAKFETIESYMLLIQSKSEVLLNQIAIGESKESDLYGEEVTSGSGDDDELVGWYKLSQNDLDQMGIEKADASDGYYVYYDMDTGSVDVAYEPGVINSNEMFYKLSDILAAGK